MTNYVILGSFFNAQYGKKKRGFIMAELLIIAVGLAMDAFAVAVCKGLNMQKLDKKQTVHIA